jgi:hypothetical protein
MHNTIYIHTEDIHNVVSPEQVVPIIMDKVKPTSVLDVGCGIGTWLSVFEEHGIKEYLGIDGEHVRKEMLKIPVTHFTTQNLTKPSSLNKIFDLALCLEVAEHLPESAADTLVEFLVRHAESILFSAAIPGQGGQNHLNEQWTAYWEIKFNKHGFYFHDSIRPLIWNNEKVQWWYKQNIFLITKQKTNEPINSIVHPELFISTHTTLNNVISGKAGVKQSFKIFTKSIAILLKKILHK